MPPSDAALPGAAPAGRPGLPAPPDATRPVDVLTVVSGADATPSVRRVLLAGTPAAAAAAGPTISLLVPRVGDPAPRWPAVARDGRIVWPAGAHGVSLRSYTARRQDPDRGEVEIDFVLHGDGPAAAWAAAAGPGATVAVAGGGPLGERPAGWLLLAGDETALPAITRILAEAAPGTRGLALVEVADVAEEQPLPAPAGVGVRWLHRDGTPPGEGTLLADAVAALDRPAGEDVFAWVAAESAAVRAVRADLRGRWGLGRAQHHAIGYWRRGRAMAPAG
ncbi:siderophore-interacting protein [Geodermatophilus sp. TF02-6]|uniref:siderophore-interacting protein n=1 Tax=Geodermatophilus sp. TF02-6 TaxID=2250575 RepID=UPI000DE89DDD|nr:siderophore-interacting protein [Geodermatophilus sp. TF02-6]RBY78166.1 siderophore-interacting protein [Geodermatophilus sp. TF02-6]